MNIKNIAIIAHVDHGKTTLIDGMLKQTETFRDNQAEMTQDAILDSNDQERERGITILAKNTTVFYKDTKINIIDTPGHADFGGEVERVIGMADGALLIVDAAEGPLPQTRFVLEQALKNHIKIIVLLNKIDRNDAEPERVLAEIEDLFLQLAADDDQLIFPILYGVGRDGKVWKEKPNSYEDPGTLLPLFDEIMDTVPSPDVDATKPFKMLVSNLEFDSYKGSYAVGKIAQGIIKKGDRLTVLEENDKKGEFSVQHIMVINGLEKKELQEGVAGDIVYITGSDDIKIGQTIVDPSDPTGFPMIKLTEPTLRIEVRPNTSPFVGKESEFCTARQLEDRLTKEMKTNIGLKIESSSLAGGFSVAGRGELHLAVMIENMRREGYEMEVGKPQVILKEIDGQTHEPVEELTIDILTEYVGVITEELGKRQALLTDSRTLDNGTAKMVFNISSRNLLGFRSEILTKTRGNGLFSSRFSGYEPLKKKREVLRNGVLIASESGVVSAYALESVQQRGSTFTPPGTSVYMGMVIGINKQREDLEVNVCKTKKLTNFRSNADISTILKPPVLLSLEQALDFIEDDELLEITPKNLRIRKKHLDKNARNKAAKKAS